MSAFVKLDYDSIVSSTVQAIEFDFGDEETIYIPVTLIDMDIFDPDEKLVHVKEWFAYEKGLI